MNNGMNRMMEGMLTGVSQCAIPRYQINVSISRMCSHTQLLHVRTMLTWCLMLLFVCCATRIANFRIGEPLNCRCKKTTHNHLIQKNEFKINAHTSAPLVHSSVEKQRSAGG